MKPHHFRASTARAPSGFTLIELMVTLAVAAVLLTLAAPSFVTFMRNSELTSQTNALVAALGTARTEAMKRGRNVLVTPKGATWNTGWVVFVDMNDNNTYQDGDFVVMDQPPLASYFTASASGTAGDTPPYVLYNSSGYPMDKNNAFAAVTISLARTDLTGQDLLDQTRRVMIANTGRVRSCKPTSTSDKQCPASGNDG